MDFSYSQEQEMLRESAAKFAAKGYGFDRYQSTLQLPGHCDAALWSQMAEFGWLGLPLPRLRTRVKRMRHATITPGKPSL